MEQPDGQRTTMILQRVRLGAEPLTAALACGVDRATASHWLTDTSAECLAFRTLIRHAEEAHVTGMTAVIHRAAMNGSAGAVAVIEEQSACKPDPKPVQRDDRGQFTKGNPGGPGRPRRATEAELTVLSEACPPERWRAICERAVTDAEAGCNKARSWVSSYLLGPPSPNRLKVLAAHECAGTDQVAGMARKLKYDDMVDQVVFSPPPAPRFAPPTMPPLPPLPAGLLRG